MKRVLAVFLLVFIAPLAGYARTEPAQAVEGDISTPYRTIGTLEVKKRVSKSGRSGRKYRKALKSILLKKAVKHYGANAVIHVHYWPDPDSGSFPQGLIYARGEMVRYVHFPAKS